VSKTVIVLDSSRIKTYLECPEKYNISYRQHRRKTWINPQWKKDYSGQGTYVHALLETYYNLRALNPSMNSLQHGTAALNLFQSLKLAPKMKLPPEFETLVNVRFTQYTIKNSLGDYQPLVHNGVPAHEVRFSIKLYEDENVIFILEGRIDLLCRVGVPAYGTVKAFIDHKTQERTSEMYEFTPQTLSYALATGFNYGGFNYFGLQQKYDEKTTLHRDFFYIPDWKIKQWKAYIIKEVYWPVANRIIQEAKYGESQADSFIWPQRWLTCAGPDLKRACDFSEICNAPTSELRELIKRQFTHIVPAWSPWND